MPDDTMCPKRNTPHGMDRRDLLKGALGLGILGAAAGSSDATGRSSLSEGNVNVITDSLATAHTAIAGESPDCVLLDFRLPDGDGLTLLPDLVSAPIAVVMCTSQGNEQIAVRALHEGADDYIVKNTLNRPARQRDPSRPPLDLCTVQEDSGR